MRVSPSGLLCIVAGAICLASLAMTWFSHGGPAFHVDITGIDAIADPSYAVPIAPLATLASGIAALCTGLPRVVLRRYPGTPGMAAWCLLFSVTGIAAVLLGSTEGYYEPGAGLIAAVLGLLMCTAASLAAFAESRLRDRAQQG